MLLSLEDVVVRRGGRDVLNGLTWSLPGGGRTLLLGRNGAGKTTTLNAICGALTPRSGVIRLGGDQASALTLRKAVALMPQGITAIPGLSIVEQVAFAGWLAGLPEAAAKTSAKVALEQVGLLELSSRKPGELSGGELRRVGLAEALVRPAELLLLDEPTAGLDPIQRARFREILTSIESPVVVSTHQLDDVTEVYERVAVIEQGRLAFSGTMNEFLAAGSGSTPGRQAESAFVDVIRSMSP